MIISVTISVVVDMCSRGDSLTPGPVGYFMSLLALSAASLQALCNDDTYRDRQVFGIN